MRHFFCDYFIVSSEFYFKKCNRLGCSGRVDNYIKLKLISLKNNALAGK